MEISEVQREASNIINIPSSLIISIIVIVAVIIIVIIYKVMIKKEKLLHNLFWEEVRDKQKIESELYQLKSEKNKMERTFEKYLDKGLMDRAIHGNLKEGKHNASFLFTDLRGYTKLVENPQMAKMILDPYFAIVTNVVHYYNGTVSQFVGDSVECMFNIPKKQQDYILAAVISGLKIKKEIERFNSARPKDFPAIRCGIGINEGEIYLSLVGGDVKRYQPIGESVIVANDLSKHSSNRVIVPKNVYDKVKDKVIAKRAGTIVVKGKTLEIYEIEDL